MLRPIGLALRALLENGGDWARFNVVIDFEIACLRQFLTFRVQVSVCCAAKYLEFLEGTLILLIP